MPAFWESNLLSKLVVRSRDLHDRRPGTIQCLLSIGTALYAVEVRKVTVSFAQTKRYRSHDMLETESKSLGFLYQSLSRSDTSVPIVNDCCSVSHVRRDVQSYIQRMRPQLQKWAESLVSFRRDRAQTVKWDRYAGLHTSCPFCGLSFERAALIEHLKKTHRSKLQALSKSVTLS